MVSKNVQDAIPKIRNYFTGRPIKKAWLFGSCSRGEETADSDVNILVQYDRKNCRISLMKITGIILALEDILKRKVDLVEDGQLLPFAQQTADHDRFLIYERED